jgi:hypothetical protein
MKFLLLIAICFSLSSVSAQDRKVALVIGNAAYKSSPLENPLNDARAMAASLRVLGFEVLERENLGREAFAKSVREYGDRLKGASVGLFYFAGHGMQVRGRNFLIPVDADIAYEDEVPYRSLDVAEILDKMDSARTAVNLVILDACRNNPFAFKAAQAGLAQIDAPTGTLIAFATAPGSLAQDGAGSNGLYTEALLKHIAAPNLAVEQMFKRVRVDVVGASKNQQVPWESSSLNRDFSFASSGTNIALSSAPQITGISDFTLELAFWSEVKNSKDPADYRAYLEQYPSGRFTALAKVRIANTQGASSQALLTMASQPILPASPIPERVVSTNSPEGLYSVSAIAGALQWKDLQKGAVVRTTPMYEAGTSEVKQLQFSGDGRWLLLSLQISNRSTHQLIDIASEKLLWERNGVAAKFDAQSPQVMIQTAQGKTEMVRLP